MLEANGDIAHALTPLHAVSVHAGEATDGESLLAQLKLLADGGAEYLVVPRADEDRLDRQVGD